MGIARVFQLVSICACIAASIAEDVVTLTTANFDQHLKDYRHTLVEFFAPWCGHCKKLAPDYEKAAAALKPKGIPLAKVDATEEKDLAGRFNVKGFPTLVWFEEGKELEYDGGRTVDSIVDWISSMTGPAVLETVDPPAPSDEKPQLVLHAESLLQGFEAAAKVNRRRATWYFTRAAGAPRVVLRHRSEEPLELAASCDDQGTVSSFLQENALPLVGMLDGDSFDRYIQAGKGLVWMLFAPEEGHFDLGEMDSQRRPMMTEVARKIRSKYHVTYTDTAKFRDALENMLSVTEFPAVAVQKKAGDKRKFIYRGEMVSDRISRFIEDVDSGAIEPTLRSEPEPPSNDEAVRVIVGSTMQRELFTPDKDVLLEVYAPWCGHCKKLEPEYTKLAKKIKKEELSDLLTIAKMDGTANDSPIDSVDWSSFPSLFFVKAGTQEVALYDGERTAKGLWKYIKKHATKAQEIKERLERRKGSKKRDEEL